MIKKIITFIIALILSPVVLMAQNTPATDGQTGATTQVGNNTATDEASADTTYVTFLTCTPGQDIHRLYGHTALRFVNANEDWAVNFGWFSFHTPNFVMKFILGLTDYSMAYQTMGIFVEDLMRDDMKVREQVLNLTPREAEYVRATVDGILTKDGFESHEYNFDGLSKPERILAAKWTYRYNFLYDNCTTRAVEVIKEALKAEGETLFYPSPGTEPTTQRTMIHEFTRTSPWFEFGQDLLLGPEVDEEHTPQELVDGLNFLPTYAEDFFAQAMVKDKDGNMRPLVAQNHDLTPFLTPKEPRPAVPLTPLMVAGILFAVAILITMMQRKAKDEKSIRAWRIWGNAFDFTIMTAQGLVGILLVIMVGWSQHPAVGTNWLLLIFNPLFFLGIPARLMGGKYETIFAWYATIMAIATMLVAICGLQQIPDAIYPLTLIVATRVKPCKNTKK